MDIDQVPVNEDPIEDDLRWSLLDARKQLYDAIVQGNIPQAFDLIYRHFPSLAAQDPNAPPTPEPRVIEHNSSIDPSHLRYILFKLRCQQFIEIIRSSDSVQAIEFAKMYLRPQHKDHQHLRDEVSVLIAYSSPEESNYRHLLNQERRQELADQVNTVVLALSNLKCETALEKIQKQITLVQKELGSIDVTQSNIDDKDNRDKMSM
ncbi:hypothetical protein VTP01DRAFT_4062 [Rhizomucor pusillus]|uniref:uncharacterized protein n=1 Tax=Rhizomucor pusillus TaxID=4840 RepID=UPI0037447D1B